MLSLRTANSETRTLNSETQTPKLVQVIGERVEIAKDFYKTLFKTEYPGKAEFGDILKKAIAKAELKKEEMDKAVAASGTRRLSWF